ncbi:AAA family ATPase [Gimesia maris]|uniref:ATP-dependent Clp protease ATP-binding subunit ClpC n=1 Tax=Gimesia maris TaxID=122 RepID=A0ABX5YIR5_9PLAN|nr:AAA family ATPase [Gimesia maris]QEG15566.1 ATP-dependent Clp protease ATP-binding subunit ClpC [Gimesia maris]QGQ31137.1 ATP-dependent Clp protease ATP-binding subunit [Gimesia maris]
MRQFINGSDEAFKDLEEKAKRGCVTFSDQEMPQGVSPSRARVGFEVDPATQKATLLVEHGGQYTGRETDIRQWIEIGACQFQNFAALKEWLQHRLSNYFTSGDQTETQGWEVPGNGNVESVSRSADELTDLSKVNSDVAGLNRPTYINAMQIAESLQERVRGQNSAMEVLAKKTAQHLARRHPRRPMTGMLLGPTGTGKTLTAESLSEVLSILMPSRNRYGFLRLDMTEYQERHRISQLIGSPQGYIGYGEGAQLVDTLSANPRTIVVFDEIEKAHPDVFRTLMNAMDAGRLSSAARTNSDHQVDCRHAIFLFTTNLECHPILEELRSKGDPISSSIINEVSRRRLKTKGLPPELVGRINTFLVFQPLSGRTRAEIMTQSIARVGQEYGVDVVTVDPRVVNKMLQEGEGVSFGARPDEYAVDDLLGGVFSSAAQQGLQQVEIRSEPELACVPAATEESC